MKVLTCNEIGIKLTVSDMHGVHTTCQVILDTEIMDTDELVRRLLDRIFYFGTEIVKEKNGTITITKA